MRSRFAIVLLAFAAPWVVTLPSEPLHQTKTASIRERLIGTWELVSTEERMKDGSKRHYTDVGPNGKGYLIYTADGHMCAQLMNPDRPQWKDSNAPTAAEKLSSFDGFSAYCGRYEIDESIATMYHYPEVAWTPQFVGTKQARPYSLREDFLTFSGKELDEPSVESYEIVWRRVQPAK